MKDVKKRKWKIKKLGGFHFYFTILVSAVVLVSVGIASFFSKHFEEWWEEVVKIPIYLPLLLISLIIGWVVSFFVGKIMLNPIKMVQKAMNQVVDGNFNVEIEENAWVDEMEDIFHVFNLMMREIRSTEVIQTDFVSNVSHEFKTPLTAIEGYATLLQDDQLSEEERKEYIERILRNTSRMSEMVGNILLLSKLDNQAIEYQNVMFDLAEQIRQTIVLLEPKWSEKQVEFDVDMEEIQYFGNEGITARIWSNLIGNAVKFSPEKGKITLRLSRHNGYVCFTIADEGKGVDEKAIKYIFDKFYQSDTSRKQEGNGLGLALVKKILDVNGGEVEVENLEPCGCKFIVRLPFEEK